MTADLEQLRERALDLATEGRCADALPLFEQVLDRRPDDDVAWMRYADCLAELGRFEDGLTATEHCRKHESVWWFALGVRARCQRGLNDLVAAAAAYEEKVAMKPSVDGLVLLAGTLKDLRRTDEAISRLNEAVDLDPEASEAHKNLGFYLCSRGRFEESESHLERALEIEPGYPQAQAALARTLICQGAQLARARALLLEALAAVPVMDGARLQLAWVEWDLGEQDTADAILTELAERVPNEGLYHWALGSFLSRTGRDDERAERHLRRCVEIDPNRASLKTLVRHLLERGRHDEAQSLLAAARHEPSHKG